MRTRIAWLVLGLAFSGAAVAASEVPLQDANVNVSNLAALQRGAKYFVNYCFGCHSAKYVRYGTLGEGLHLTNDQLVKNLMFTGKRPGDTMQNAMQPDDAKRWFGIAPPDLTLIARSRGADYLYTFLRSFYKDPSTATGANNLVLPGTAMPDILWRAQGIQQAVFKKNKDGENVFEKLEMLQPGDMTPQQFDRMDRDIVTFLQYIGEPVAQERKALGKGVVIFLFVFLILAYLLKKEIWKDVE
jgi:ubiquinol-cytochrome c reductase cytochrome c1 subunit